MHEMQTNQIILPKTTGNSYIDDHMVTLVWTQASRPQLKWHFSEKADIQQIHHSFPVLQSMDDKQTKLGYE